MYKRRRSKESEGQGCKHASQLGKFGVKRREVMAWEEMG